MKLINNIYALSYFKETGARLKNDLNLLKTYMGISQISYSKLFYDSSYFIISSDPSVVDDCVAADKSKIILTDKIFQPHKGYGILVWPKKATIDTTHNAYISACRKNNHWHGISFFKKFKDHTAFFRFTSDIHNEFASNFYIKNYKILIAFVEYWLNNNINRLDLNTPKLLATFSNGVDFSNLYKMELKCNDQQDKLKKFLAVIRAKGANLRTQNANVHITARELECLGLLAKGHSAKEVANLLQLSNRTVEGHISNIRRKAGSIYKSDLIKLYIEQIVDLSF